MIARWAFVASGLVLVASLAFVVPRWNQPAQVGPGFWFLAAWAVIWLSLAVTLISGAWWLSDRHDSIIAGILLIAGVLVALVPLFIVAGWMLIGWHFGFRD